MKTTDLIPIILYQLIDGDRYGYEIVKQVEDISSGNIVIKQPTLYSVLKKLEQGRFITSYWQDSEIGGKRHYYKLTDNGRAQLSTYPPLETLISDVLAEDGVVVPTSNVSTPKPQKSQSQPQANTVEIEPIDILNNDVEEIQPITIDLSSPTGIKMDVNYNLPQQEEVEIDLTSPINTTPIDESAITNTTSINIFEVIEPQKSQSSTSSNVFDAIEPIIDTKPDSIFDAVEVATPNEFTVSDVDLPKSEDQYNAISKEVTDDIKTDFNIAPTTIDIEKVPFLNYIDFSKDEETIKRKKSIANHIKKMALTVTSLLLLLILSIVVCSKYSFSKVYCVSAIIAVAVIIIYPINLLTKLSKIRLKYCSSPFKYSLSRDFFIKLSLFLSLVVVVFAYNISYATTVAEIFKMDNFANFVAPIMLGATIMLDFVFGLILYKQYTNKQK